MGLAGLHSIGHQWRIFPTEEFANKAADTAGTNPVLILYFISKRPVEMQYVSPGYCFQFTDCTTVCTTEESWFDILHKQEILSVRVFTSAPLSTLPLIQWEYDIFLGVERLGPDVDHSSPCNKTRNEWSNTSTHSCLFMACTVSTLPFLYLTK